MGVVIGVVYRIHIFCKKHETHIRQELKKQLGSTDRLSSKVNLKNLFCEKL